MVWVDSEGIGVMPDSGGVYGVLQGEYIITRALGCD
jgi:hypothetical protein